MQPIYTQDEVNNGQFHQFSDYHCNHQQGVIGLIFSVCVPSDGRSDMLHISRELIVSATRSLCKQDVMNVMWDHIMPHLLVLIQRNINVAN